MNSFQKRSLVRIRERYPSFEFLFLGLRDVHVQLETTGV